MKCGNKLARFVAVVFILFAALLTSAVGGSARLISEPDRGQARSASAGGDSWSPILTPDGRFVLFASTANNLVLMTNGNSIPVSVPVHQNVYLRDRQAGTTVLISVNLSGVAGANGDSMPADLSANGRYALFESSASDLVPGDTNNVVDVFMRDVIKGTTALVSVGTNLTIADGASRSSVCTPDGRFAAFVSEADNLVQADTNRIADVFVRDLIAGTTTLVSAGANGTNSNPGSGSSESPLITPDGRHVAFFSTAANLVPNVGGTPEIYVRDLLGGTTVWASAYARTALLSIVPSTNAVSYNHCINADGKFVAYEASLDPSLTRTYPSLAGFVLRYSVASGLTDLISSSANIPMGAYPDIRSLDMTPDGRFVAFLEDENNNSGNTTAVMVWDALTNALTLASVSTNQDVSYGSTCDWPVLDPSGRFVAFFSSAPDLVTNALAGNYHLYLTDLQTQTTTLVDADTNQNGLIVVPATIPRISADGRWVAFESPDGNLVANDRNHDFDVFVRDVSAKATELISVNHPALVSQTPNGPSALSLWSASADGRYVAFSSDADDLVSGDTNGCRDAFVRDLVTGTNFLVSVDQFGQSSGNGVSTDPVISLDGRYVAFTSSATNLVAGDSNQCQDVFIRDRQAGTNGLVSWNFSGTGPANNHSYSPFLSGDGRFVLFRSLSTNLATGVFNGAENLYLRDLGQGKTRALTTSGFSSAAMTRDGRFVAYSDTLGHLFVWNSLSGSVTYSQTVVGGLRTVAISPDGSKVVYWTTTTPQQLIAVDPVARTNWVVESASPASKAGLRFSADSRYLAYAATPAGETASQVYLYDFQSAARIRVSRNFAGASSANGASDEPEISPDGRFVAFRSAASDIVANDTNSLPDLLLFDQATQTMALLSASQSGLGTANNRSLAPVFTSDGQMVLFQSWASDLTPQDFNQGDDIFAATLLYAGISATAGSTQGFQLSWPAMPGTNYRVQFKASLNDPGWIEATGSITNFGTKDYFNQSAPGATQRFYRILAY